MPCLPGRNTKTYICLQFQAFCPYNGSASLKWGYDGSVLREKVLEGSASVLSFGVGHTLSRINNANNSVRIKSGFPLFCDPAPTLSFSVGCAPPAPALPCPAPSRQQTQAGKGLADPMSVCRVGVMGKRGSRRNDGAADAAAAAAAEDEDAEGEKENADERFRFSSPSPKMRGSGISGNATSHRRSSSTSNVNSRNGTSYGGGGDGGSSGSKGGGRSGSGSCGESGGGRDGGGGSCSVNAFDLMPPPMPRTPGGGGGGVKGQQQQQQQQQRGFRSPSHTRSSPPVSPLGQHDPNRRQEENTDHTGGGGIDRGEQEGAGAKFGPGRVEKRTDVKVLDG